MSLFAPELLAEGRSVNVTVPYSELVRYDSTGSPLWGGENNSQPAPHTGGWQRRSKPRGARLKELPSLWPKSESRVEIVELAFTGAFGIALSSLERLIQLCCRLGYLPIHIRSFPTPRIAVLT